MLDAITKRSEDATPIHEARGSAPTEADKFTVSHKWLDSLVALSRAQKADIAWLLGQLKELQDAVKVLSDLQPSLKEALEAIVRNNSFNNIARNSAQTLLSVITSPEAK